MAQKGTHAHTYMVTPDVASLVALGWKSAARGELRSIHGDRSRNFTADLSSIATSRRRIDSTSLSQLLQGDSQHLSWRQDTALPGVGDQLKGQLTPKCFASSSAIDDNKPGPSRCFPFWQELLACYVVNTSGDDDSGKKKCAPALEDYYECLHHKKEVRNNSFLTLL